jgi:TolA-binding protein
VLETAPVPADRGKPKEPSLSRAEGLGREEVMKLPYLALAGLILSDAAAAQRSDDRAQFDARMNMLERSVVDLSIQIEQLKAQDQQFQQRLEKMRVDYDQRLERLEKGAPPKATTPRR